MAFRWVFYEELYHLNICWEQFCRRSGPDQLIFLASCCYTFILTYLHTYLSRGQLTSNVEYCLAGNLAELVASSKLVLASILWLNVVNEQHHDAVVVADVVASGRMDLSSGRRPGQPRRWVRLQAGFQPAPQPKHWHWAYVCWANVSTAININKTVGQCTSQCDQQQVLFRPFQTVFASSFTTS